MSAKCFYQADGGKARVLMRREGNLEVILNSALFKGMAVTRRYTLKSDKKISLSNLIKKSFYGRFQAGRKKHEGLSENKPCHVICILTTILNDVNTNDKI